MKKESEEWARLEQVIRWSRLSINAFALRAGLKSPAGFYRIRNGTQRLSKHTAAAIAAAYPEISYTWLTTGTGEMLEKEDDYAENAALRSIRQLQEKTKADTRLRTGVELNFSVRLTVEEAERVLALLKEQDAPKNE